MLARLHGRERAAPYLFGPPKPVAAMVALRSFLPGLLISTPNLNRIDNVSKRLDDLSASLHSPVPILGIGNRSVQKQQLGDPNISSSAPLMQGIHPVFQKALSLACTVSDSRSGSILSYGTHVHASCTTQSDRLQTPTTIMEFGGRNLNGLS